MESEFFRLDPSLTVDEKTGKITVIFHVYGRTTGKEILTVELPNTPDWMKTIDFFESKEWDVMRPKIEKVCQDILSIIYDRS